MNGWLIPLAPIEICPHCGGKGGYEFKIRLDAKRFEAWDGDVIDTDNYKLVSQGKPYCMDCGKCVSKYFRKEK